MHNTNEEVASGQTFLSPGPITFDIHGTDSFGFDLAAFTGTGTATLDLRLFATAGDTFATSTTGLTGTITYDFTPVTVPESGSLSLFGVGLASLLGSMRLRATRER
jgi:hypothetical protein